MRKDAQRNCERILGAAKEWARPFILFWDDLLTAEVADDAYRAPGIKSQRGELLARTRASTHRAPAGEAGAREKKALLPRRLMPRRSGKRWVSSVKTDSTHPPSGLFTKSSATIARTLASKKVSPKGPGSGLRMLTYFINRAGRGLPAKRRAELQKAKHLLSARIKREKESAARKAA